MGEEGYIEEQRRGEKSNEGNRGHRCMGGDEDYGGDRRRSAGIDVRELMRVTGATEGREL